MRGRFRPVRTLIAGLAGGIAMFAWATVAHEATPLDGVGISAIDDEDGARQALLDKLGTRSGLYQFPSKARLDAATTPAEKAALAKRPYGLVVYHPPGPGAAGLSGSQITFEFLFELVEAMIVAFLLAAASLHFWLGRVAFAGGMGLVAVMTTNASYWTFYGFPLDYSLIDFIRYLAAGCVIAAILKPAAANRKE